MRKVTRIIFVCVGLANVLLARDIKHISTLIDKSVLKVSPDIVVEYSVDVAPIALFGSLADHVEVLDYHTQKLFFDNEVQRGALALADVTTSQGKMFFVQTPT